MPYLEKIFAVVDGNEKNRDLYFEIRSKILVERGFNQDFIDENLESVTAVLENPYYYFFLAYLQDQVVGYLRLFVGESPINRHVAKLKMSLLKQHNRPDYKKKLLQKALTFGIEQDIKRMEMIVEQERFEDVSQLIHLGFQIEGKLKRMSYHSVGERYSDSYLVAKML